MYDVGVAGIHRLLDTLKSLHTARVIIVVAGMEGALPSVVGGLTDKPIVAVPTSVGYGTNLGGLTALFAMLCQIDVCSVPARQIRYDFLLVFVKNPVSFFRTLSLSQCGHFIPGFVSNSLIERNTVNSLLQSLQTYS